MELPKNKNDTFSNGKKRSIYVFKKVYFFKLLKQLKIIKEKVRIGGIDENTPIKDFTYFKLDFSNELIKEFQNMQNKYVLNDKYKNTIDEVKNILTDIYNKICIF